MLNDIASQPSADAGVVVKTTTTDGNAIPTIAQLVGTAGSDLMINKELLITRPAVTSSGTIDRNVLNELRSSAKGAMSELSSILAKLKATNDTENIIGRLKQRLASVETIIEKKNEILKALRLSQSNLARLENALYRATELKKAQIQTDENLRKTRAIESIKGRKLPLSQVQELLNCGTPDDPKTDETIQFSDEMMSKRFDIVVTRHPAMVVYLKGLRLIDENTKVVKHALPEELAGKHVCGILPKSIAARCATFTEISLILPKGFRGVELTVEQIEQFAGKPTTFKIRVV